MWRTEEYLSKNVFQNLIKPEKIAQDNGLQYHDDAMEKEKKFQNAYEEQRKDVD